MNLIEQKSVEWSMGKVGEMWRRLGMLARREKFGRELDEEMRLHREMKERELEE